MMKGRKWSVKRSPIRLFDDDDAQCIKQERSTKQFFRGMSKRNAAKRVISIDRTSPEI